MAIRIGVIGAGALGFHHTRILRDVPGAPQELAAIIERVRKE